MPLFRIGFSRLCQTDNSAPPARARRHEPGSQADQSRLNVEAIFDLKP